MVQIHKVYEPTGSINGSEVTIEFNGKIVKVGVICASGSDGQGFFDKDNVQVKLDEKLDSITRTYIINNRFKYNSKSDVITLLPQEYDIVEGD